MIMNIKFIRCNTNPKKNHELFVDLGFVDSEFVDSGFVDAGYSFILASDELIKIDRVS
jgi:hypothetical protein